MNTTINVKRAFVTGASGFVGKHLVKYLQQHNIQVRALVRSEQAVDEVEQLGAEAIRGNLDEVHNLEVGMSGCDVVFHLAARAGMWGPYADFYRVNVLGTEHVVAAARAAGVPRIVHVSTEAVLAGSPIRNADETQARPVHPIGNYAISKGKAEEVMLAANSPELATVIVRPRAIWGPGSPFIPQLSAMVREGKFLWIDGGRYLTSSCHVTNVCEGLLLAAQQGCGGEIYFVSDGKPIEFRAFALSILQTQNLTPGKKSVPGWLALLLSTCIEEYWRLSKRTDEPPLTRLTVKLMGEEVTVNDAKARHELGYVGNVTLEAGLAELQNTTDDLS